MVSLHFVNVYHTLVAPDGGRDQRFGTNPVCLAVPGTAENPGVQLDMATSIVAMGKVSVKFRAGEQTPDGAPPRAYPGKCSGVVLMGSVVAVEQAG